jgi:DNA polymerase I-like protein with 3'-5' exonuclease and polymerase domains
MCINFRTTNQNVYTLAQEAELRRALNETLTHPDIKFIAQNNSFDAGWLWFKDRIKVAPCWMDTMLAHHTLYPSLPHGLGYITAQYTDYPYYKDELSEWKETGDIDSFWQYNVKDCIVTRIAALKMLDELRAQHLDKFFFNHVMRLQPYLIQMQVGGVKADVERKERIVEDLGMILALSTSQSSNSSGEEQALMRRIASVCEHILEPVRQLESCLMQLTTIVKKTNSTTLTQLRASTQTDASDASILRSELPTPQAD